MRLRVLSPALEEISDAALWLETQAPGLGGELWAAIDRLLSEIEEAPTRFAKSEHATEHIDLRYVYVARFKYVIHFSLDADEVVVAAVSHAARKPGYWLCRIKR